MASTLSVIIPAYNAAAFVHETIASVAAQARRPDELIVVDDGSTDGTAEVAERALDATGIPGQLIRQENGGVAVARNRGALASHGDLVTFIDADDILLPDHLALACDHLDGNPDAVAYFSDVREFDAKGDRDGSIRGKSIGRRRDIRTTPAATPEAVLLGDGLTGALLLGNFITNSSVVIRRTALARTGLFDVTFSIGEDRDLYMRLSLIGPFVEVERVTARQRRHPASVMARRNNLQWAETSLRLLAAFRDRHPDRLAQGSLAEAFAHAQRTWVAIAMREASRAGLGALRRMRASCKQLGHPARPGLRDIARAVRAGLSPQAATPPGVDVSVVVPRTNNS